MDLNNEADVKKIQDTMEALFGNSEIAYSLSLVDSARPDEDGNAALMGNRPAAMLAMMMAEAVRNLKANAVMELLEALTGGKAEVAVVTVGTEPGDAV